MYHFMNSKFLASLLSSKPRTFVFMLSKGRLSFPSDETCYAFVVQYLSAHSNMKRHSLCQALLLQEVYLWCLASLRIFLLCTPFIPPLHRPTSFSGLIYGAVLISVEPESDSLMIAVAACSNTKRDKVSNVCIWKMTILYGFSKACVTFQFSFCSIPNGRFEN